MDLLSTLTGGAQGVAGIFNVLEQRKWNERAEAQSWDMYQQERQDAATAHQRATKDLKAAGLNPILAAGKGLGSPVATGTASSPTSPNLLAPDLMNIFATAKGLEQRDKEIDLHSKRLEMEALNSILERDYKRVITKNEKYGIQGMMSDFFRELKNERGDHLNLNDIMNFIQRFQPSSMGLNYKKD